MSIDDHHYPIVMFANEMFKELEKHDDENQIKFYNKSLPKLFEMLSEQYNHRIKKIENTIFQEGTPLSEVEKNCIHMANLFYFIWASVQQIKDENLRSRLQS